MTVRLIVNIAKDLINHGQRIITINQIKLISQSNILFTLEFRIRGISFYNIRAVNHFLIALTACPIIAAKSCLLQSVREALADDFPSRVGIQTKHTCITAIPNFRPSCQNLFDRIVCHIIIGVNTDI